VYLLDRDILEYIPKAKPVSIEKDVFPGIAQRGHKYKGICFKECNDGYRYTGKILRGLEKVHPKGKIMELKKSFRPEYAALAIIFGAILYLAGSTWLKCGDMIIDTFRDPLISLKVMSGQTLYKDMFYEYGFFAPHCLALVFRLFGVSTVTLAVFGLSVTVSMSLVLYAIARHFLDITASLLVVLTFLFAFAFGFYSYNGIFNFVMPYSHSSVFFSLFSAFSVLCFIRFVFTDKTRYLALWAVSMLLTFLCRIDAPIMVWGAFFIIFLLKARKENGFRFSLKDLWVFVPLVGAFIFYFVYLRSTGALDPF
jgi:hypothetical protein